MSESIEQGPSEPKINKYPAHANHATHTLSKDEFFFSSLVDSLSCANVNSLEGKVIFFRKLKSNPDIFTR